MKSKIIYTLLSLILFAFTGCKQDDEPIYTPQPISFSASVNSQQMTKVSLPGDGNASEFEKDDKIGVYMRISNAPATVTYYNNLHTKLTTEANFAPPSEVGSMTFKTHDNHDFISYHPYTADAPNTLTNHLFSVQSDQTTKILYNASDLMYANTQNIQPLRGDATSVALEFAHKLSQIRVKVTNKVASTPFYGKPPVIHMINPKSKAALNLADGTVKTNDTDIHEKLHFLLTTNYVSGKTTVLDFIAIVPPHTVPASEVSFQLTAGILDYDVKLPENLILKEGFQHSVYATVQGLNIIVDGGEVKPWNDGINITHNIDDVYGQAAKMTLNFSESSTANLNDVKTVELTIDGNTYDANVKSADPKNAILVISYSQGKKWGVNLTKIVLKNVNNGILNTFEGTWTITGNPTLPDYNDVLLVIAEDQNLGVDGEIDPWVNGTDIDRSIGDVPGRAVAVNLDLTRSSVENLNDVKTVELTIDGNTYPVNVISADPNNNILVISYSHNANRRVNVTKIVLKNENNAILNTFEGTWTITGNPTAPDYGDILVVTPL